MKLKGIPKKCLKPEYYGLDKDSPTEHKVDYTSLKKKHTKLSKKDVENGVEHFSIVELKCSRTIHKSSFSGMNRIGNEWYPRGYRRIEECNTDTIVF